MDQIASQSDGGAALDTPAEYVVRLFVVGDRPARTERMEVEAESIAIDISRRRLQSSRTFTRAVVYCDGRPVCDLRQDPPRWTPEA
jgi:hypothetical protein